MFLKLKKIVAIILVFVFSASLTVTAHAEESTLDNFTKWQAYQSGTFTDLGTGNTAWANDYIIEAYEYGILTGMSDTAMQPSGVVSVRQLLTIVARMHAIYNFSDASYPYTAFTTGVNEPWYMPYYMYCMEFRLVSESILDAALRDENATRLQAFFCLYNVLDSKDLQSVNTVNALPDIREGDLYFTEIKTLYSAGILTGMDGLGTLNPGGSLKRAEFAAVFMRVLNKGSGVRVSGRVYGEAPTEEIPVKPVDNVSLQGVPLFGSVSDATAALGEAKSTYNYTDSVVCRVYRSDSYGDLVLIQSVGDEIVAIYAMGTGLSVPAASTNYNVVTYTDENDGNQLYAVMLTRSGAQMVSSNITTAEMLIFELTNGFRALHGVNALTWNSLLATSAKTHAQDMASNDYFSHTSLSGASAGTRITGAGYDWRAYGENISAGYGMNPFANINGWISSKGHRENMLNSSFKDLGVGVALSSGSSYGSYSVQNFGTQK